LFRRFAAVSLLPAYFIVRPFRLGQSDRVAPPDCLHLRLTAVTGLPDYQCTLSACILYDNLACSHASFIPVFELCAWGRGEHLFFCPRRITEGHGELLFCPRRNAYGRGGHRGRMGFPLRSCATLPCSAPICHRKSLFRQTSTSPSWYSSSLLALQRSNG